MGLLTPEDLPGIDYTYKRLVDQPSVKLDINDDATWDCYEEDDIDTVYRVVGKLSANGDPRLGPVLDAVNVTLISTTLILSYLTITIPRRIPERAAYYARAREHLTRFRPDVEALLRGLG